MALAYQDQDIKLVDRVISGSTEAFDLLFCKYKQMVFNVCLGILGSKDDAADVTQKTFLQVYKSISRFKNDSSFRTWLFRIATNTSLQALRKQSRRQQYPLVADIPAAIKPCNDRIWEALFELPPDIRAVIVLFYFQGLSGRELSEALGCSEGSARIRLHRARQAFKDKYEKVGK